MKAATRKHKYKIVRLQNSIERTGIRLFRSYFRDVYKSNLDKLLQLPPAQWESMIGVNKADITNLFVRYYQLSSKIAIITRKHLLNQKADFEDAIWQNAFAEKMKNIVINDAGFKITSIINTTENNLKKTVRSVLAEGDELGWGIEKIQRELVKKVGQNLKGNAYARARAIAQTEMISASNQSSMMAAESTGYETRKFWSVSGLEGMRDSHVQNQEYSDTVNGLKMNEYFPNGLLYPGDMMNGTAEEVINCRCTILHEII